jgi:hypothetical protein
MLKHDQLEQAIAEMLARPAARAVARRGADPTVGPLLEIAARSAICRAPGSARN